MTCAGGVTQPRHIRPHATYAICRRVEGRRYLLRPDAVLNALFTWVLAVTAPALDVEVHVATVMSTHFHLVVTVPNENVSLFMERLDFRLAKALQVLRRFVKGVIWAPGKLSIVELVTPAAVVEAIAYAIVNPVKAGLVYEASDWPGVTASAADIGIRALEGTIPAFYFDRRKWAESASVPLTLPPCLRALGDPDAARALIAAEVSHQEGEARAYVKEQGWKVWGRHAVMSVSPYRCAKSWEEIGKLAPHIAAGRGNCEERIAAIRELQAFRIAHREAKARWMAGDRDVVFPAGTYWMRIHHGARVASFD